MGTTANNERFTFYFVSLRCLRILACMMNCVTVRSARYFQKGIISQFRNDLLVWSASSVTCAHSVCDLCKVSKVLSYRTTLGFQYCSFATPRPCYLSNEVKLYGRVFNQSVVFFAMLGVQYRVLIVS